ncbi:MAG: AIR synthase related protein [Phycisphaerales bacterium]
MGREAERGARGVGRGERGGDRVRVRSSLASADPSVLSAASPVTSASSAFGSTLPAGCLHPKRVLTEVVAGVRDYGNRMGIPTVSGAVWFDDRHIGNPLVFCGCVGVMPRWAVGGKARAGDRTVALGGRTGRWDPRRRSSGRTDGHPCG